MVVLVMAAFVVALVALVATVALLSLVGGILLFAFIGVMQDQQLYLGSVRNTGHCVV